MRILVCGGRDYGEYKWPMKQSDPKDVECIEGQIKLLQDKLKELADEFGRIEIIEGGARGADRHAREWAISNNIKFSTFHADWGQYGKRAGILRNIEMLERGDPVLVIAFPGRRGTAHMVGIAKKAGVKVIEV